MEHYTRCADAVTAIGDETTVGAVYESIETHLWIADAYRRRGSEGLAAECLRSAWNEFVRFRDVLRIYGGESLGGRLVTALAQLPTTAPMGFSEETAANSYATSR